MTLIALYAGCLVLGGILIGASMLGAGKDADADHDMSHDHDAGHEVEVEAEADADLDHTHGHDAHAVDHTHGPLSPIAATLLSLRFWTFALASFGMSGLLLTLIETQAFLTLGLAAITGVFVGASVTTLLRVISRDTVSSTLASSSLRGKDAEVILSVGPGKLGKVRLTHNGQTIELPATTKDERLIERGERILLVDVAGGTADVTASTPDRRLPSPLPTTS